MKTDYLAHGKLLLSGEYAVLDGALALAVPTGPGQRLSIRDGERGALQWIGREMDGSVWLEVRFTRDEILKPLVPKDFPSDPRERLLYLLQAAGALQPGFLNRLAGCRVETHLEFPRKWGLGTSSTLVANIAAWSRADPYDLLAKTFGGSGYDIACAAADGPIFYRQMPGGRLVEPAAFHPPFAGQLKFIYLNQKQESREGIRRYREQGKPPSTELEEVSRLAAAMASAGDLEDFRRAVDRHEELVSGWLGLRPVGERLFPDFDGSVKSLGAWGGDFILAAGGSSPETYFRARGYETCLGYAQLVRT